MDIHGLQKMTLLDYPGHTACTIFLAGCNFRCPFCHNSELLTASTAEAVTDDESFIGFLEKRRGLLDGVAVTGGEPLLSAGLVGLLQRIKQMGFSIKLDTNGSFPDKLKEILDAGLADYVAMDIKNSPQLYPETAGISNPNMNAIQHSVRMLIEGDTDYEFRTTVVEQLHDASSFEGIGRLIKGAKRCFIQPFIDRDTVAFSGLSAPSREKIELYADILRRYVDSVDIRGMDR